MDFDVLIRSGIIVDGSGRQAAFRADIGILGDRIAAIGRLDGATGAQVLDAQGKVVCPGFIDVHVHSELALLGGPYRYAALAQGVTTHLTAADGFGWAPLPASLGREMWENLLFAYGPHDLDVNWPTVANYLSIFEHEIPANLVLQIPHCAVRFAVMGWEPRPADDDELDRMKEVAREWLDAGAVCLNLGLDYQPSAFADLRELVELAKLTREHGGLYAAHIRSNLLGTAGAWRETMEIGRQADIPVHTSHSFVTDATEPLLEEADRTCELTFDSYMYPAGATHLAMVLPVWAQAGGPAGIRARLRHPEIRRRLGEHLQARLTATAHEGGKHVFAVTQTGRYVGESITEAAASQGLQVGEFALRVLEEEDPFALMIYHHGGMEEREVARRTVRHPRMMVASDGIYHGEYSHPRASGCFARVLRLCVRELAAVSLEAAVHKMSGFPAERFRIKDRGLVRPGFGADLVIFDPATVADRATWSSPRLGPVGIERVIVNGQVVIEDGRPTGRLPGRVLQPLT